MPESLERRRALSLRHRPMVLMQLVHKPTIRRSRRPTHTHELERLRRMQSMRSNEVPTHDSDGAGRAHRTMDEHPRLGAPPKRTGDIARRAREVRSELRERRVVQGDLHRVSCERGRQRDAPWHRGEDVCDAERGERSGVLRRLEVRDV